MLLRFGGNKIMGNKKKNKIKPDADAQGTTQKRDKKSEVLGKKKSSGGGKSTIMGAGIAIAIVAVIAFVMFGGGGGGAFKVVTAEAGVVTIPIAEVSDSKAHFYSYHSKSGKTVNFFVLKSSDGVIRAAFDACDVCYKEKKGYRQEGDLMVCNNCGQRFPSVKINEIKGGCNPSPLKREVKGTNLVITAADIEQGGFYF
jgi:hypothetical protein